jgi:hypothetical protein
MRNAVQSLAALLRSRPFQPASPDLAERIIRKAKRIQGAQTKPRKDSVVPEEATQKKEDP